jgi:hypothetical protein
MSRTTISRCDIAVNAFDEKGKIAHHIGCDEKCESEIILRDCAGSAGVSPNAA